MFDGQVGRRTRVSMGGKKLPAKELSKHDFVIAAREERVKRARSRLVHETSTKLQAWFRGCRTRAITRASLQHAVVAKCNDVATLQRMYTFAIPVPVLTRLVQETIFVGRLWQPPATADAVVVPCSVLGLVQQSWTALQIEWDRSPSSKHEWTVRVASLCSLVSRLRPSDLQGILPLVAESLPHALYLWAIRPSFGFFDAVVEAWTRDRHHQFPALAPYVDTLVQSYALHEAFACTLMSLPLSAQQPALKPWLDASYLHLPANTLWITSPWQQAVVVGNLLDLLNSYNQVETTAVTLLVQYTCQSVVDFALNSSTIQTQLQLIASRSIVSKLWLSALQQPTPRLVYGVAQVYAWLLTGHPSSSPLVSTVLFTISSSSAILRHVFRLLQSLPSPLWLIFCSSFGSYIDTSDAHTLSNHFPQIPELVTLLSHTLYGILWRESPTVYSIESEAQLSAMVHLFNQLHARVESIALWPSLPIPPDVMTFEEEKNDKTVKVFFESNTRAKLQYVLTTIPQVVPFETRVALFHSYLHLDKQNVPNRHVFAALVPLRIQREHIVTDSFEQFHAIQSLKGRLQITFVNAQGLEEAGVDGGGVFKEYIDTLTKTAFSTEFPYFLATDDHQLYPNPQAHLSSDDAVAYFRFLGRLLAKAMYEEILIEPQFALFFLKKLLGQFNSLDDLRSLDAQMYRHVLELKTIPDVESLGLTFTAASGPHSVHELETNGGEVAVTGENVIRYIHKLADFKLNVQIAAASRAFLVGFHDLIPSTWLRLFSPVR
ncbi:hypothetical protein, variant [Aphanomyces astaci]|uniref:HECT-type E3 ubiquitin transferase n=1 Tax=Aphanomyces astaci TaxID=112090 RepID=W4FFV1_APHAT|nr:hypothetical protein, variant [Aphanomyces astaci]ETV65749.1 hypothetical protein, variant [Aphanomyces astaci]|eukprot:XP_009844724.1 hypothetical protein, variant [Aphanomyces astaci]